MRRVAGLVVAFALTILSLGTIPTAPAGTGGPAVPIVDDCGCAMRFLSLSVRPAQTIGPEVNFTLAGDAARGWGFSNATISRPGPKLTVYLGDLVTLTLVANDAEPHNWFIDYNGDQQPNAGEPSSPDFNTQTDKVIVWNFTADRPGSWTYRCRYHPSTMTGTLEVLAIGRPLNKTLYGHAIRGWGETNATIADPGPEIIVGVGAVVTLTLVANDSQPHNWFIDYNGDQQPNAGEPSSPDFNTQTDKVIVWNFTADRPGQFTYRCRYHPNTMVETIIILGEERPVSSGLGIGLIPGILLISLGGVLVFALVYHARAVRATKRRP